MRSQVKTIIQCDFDNTIAERDASFLLLDAFGDKNWRQLLRQYREGRISVGTFNMRAFRTVRADKQTMLDFIFKREVKIRPGLKELLTYCAQKGFEFVIVSNGLSFYIEEILKSIGVDNIKVFAAQTQFQPEGLEVKFIGPDGNYLDGGFKESYTDFFLRQGYRVIYIGDGASDVAPARKAHHVFARDELLKRCQETGIDCTPFNDLNDVVRGLETLH